MRYNLLTIAFFIFFNLLTFPSSWLSFNTYQNNSPCVRDGLHSMQSTEISKSQQDDLIVFIDYCYGLICSACGNKVLDPDKKKGQIIFNGKCPSCGEVSTAPKKEQKKSRKQRRAERRALREANRNGQ